MGKIPAMGDDYTEVNRGVRDSGRVTITEAAALLGVHPNTVRSRVKAGVYDAEKVSTEYGLTWMIDHDSLINNPLPRASQLTPSQMVNLEVSTPTEIVQVLLRPFVEDLGKVREQLGTERVLREQAERDRDRLVAELEALRQTRDAPETASEDTESVDVPPVQQEPVESQEAREEAERLRAEVDAERLRAQVEAERLREELEAERTKGFWRRLFGG
jgi:hypothetical protein